eukprot:TRINITY_DN6651_c0_g1_i1.p1 TRINITY_DN6651_c0_g1~~TRINITY_DN6651_c0_g1_i1.p1  ORF type:complete len:336 (+),score=33.33 TRINITY_DN6651_c0_g1_i1:54-1061(+)
MVRIASAYSRIQSRQLLPAFRRLQPCQRGAANVAPDMPKQVKAIREKAEDFEPLMQQIDSIRIRFSLVHVAKFWSPEYLYARDEEHRRDILQEVLHTELLNLAIGGRHSTYDGRFERIAHRIRLQCKVLDHQIRPPPFPQYARYYWWQEAGQWDIKYRTESTRSRIHHMFDSLPQATQEEWRQRYWDAKASHMQIKRKWEYDNVAYMWAIRYLREECEPLSLEEFCLDYKEKCHSILSGPGNPLGDYKTALPEKQLEVQELQRKHNLQRSKRFIYESLKQGIFFLVPSYKRMSHTKWSWLDTTLEKLGHKRLFDTIADVEQLKAMYSLKELRQMY